MEIDRGQLHEPTLAAQFTFLSVECRCLPIHKFDIRINSSEVAQVRCATLTVSEVSEYLVIGIENIHTHTHHQHQ